MSTTLPIGDTPGGIREAAVRFGQGVFSVRETTGQLLAAGSTGIVNFNTAENNPDGWYNVSTYKYIPLKPGYYLFTASLQATADRTAAVAMYLVVNGSEVRVLDRISSDRVLAGSCIYKMNGTTDYAQIGVNPTTDGYVLANASTRNWFQGVLISTKP